MKRIITLLTAVFCIASLHVFAADPTEHIWYGEELINDDPNYNHEFYIYNVGTKKFLGLTSATSPDETTPLAFRFIKNNDRWFIKNNQGILRIYYTTFILPIYHAVCNHSDDGFGENLATNLETSTSASDDARGIVYRFFSNQNDQNNIKDYCFYVNDDGTYKAVLRRDKNNVEIIHDESLEGNAKFLLISPDQYNAEIARRAAAINVQYKSNEDVTAFLVNPNIIQTQWTNKMVPYGWTSNNNVFQSGNNFYTKEINSGIFNGDTHLECWHGTPANINFDYSQKVFLQAGRYKLSANAFFRGNAGTIALYAEGNYIDGNEVTEPITIAGDQKNNIELDFNVLIGSNVNIGFKKVGDNSSSSYGDAWFGADDFQLNFLGNIEKTIIDNFLVGEDPFAVSDKSYYLYNVGAHRWIGNDNTPKSDAKDAILFTINNTNQSGVYSGGKYTITADNGNIKLCMRLASGYQAGVNLFDDECIFNEIHKTERNTYFLRALAKRHSFAVENSGDAYGAHITEDEYAEWMFISEEQIKAYKDYEDQYEDARDAYDKYQDDENLPKDIYDDLIESLNKPGKYDPDPENEKNSQAEEELEDANDQIWKFFHEDRETPAGKFGTICLPYSFKCNTNENNENKELVFLYKIQNITSDGVVNLETVNFSETESGRGYIYKVAEGEKQEFEYSGGGIVESPLDDPADYLQGLLPGHLSVPEGAYILGTKPGTTGQFFYKMNKTQNGKPYMAYMKNPKDMGITTNISAFKFSTEEGDVVDRIANILNGNEVPTIYDMSGRKLDNLQKGVNIVNGIKFFVK